MKVDKIFMGLKTNSQLDTRPQKIIIESIREGANLIKRKTVISKDGKAVAELTNDTLTINGKTISPSLLHDLGAENTPRTAGKVIFENFEQFFNPNYNAWTEIAKTFK